MGPLNLIKEQIEGMLRDRYKTVTIREGQFFKTKTGVPFRLFSFTDSLGIEYADTWEDGDLFYPEDYGSADDMFADMISEIDSI